MCSFDDIKELKIQPSKGIVGGGGAQYTIYSVAVFLNSFAKIKIVHTIWCFFVVVAFKLNCDIFCCSKKISNNFSTFRFANLQCKFSVLTTFYSMYFCRQRRQQISNFKMYALLEIMRMMMYRVLSFSLFRIHSEN